MKDTDYAFPITHGEIWSHGGLTKREWFAGMALMGFMADPTDHLPAVNANIGLYVETAFKLADAMLAETQKTGGGS